MLEKLIEMTNFLLTPLRRFWRWWGHELAAFADRFSTNRTHVEERRNNALLFDLSLDGVAVSEQKGQDFRTIGRFAAAEPDPKLLQQLFCEITAILTGDMQVIIRLPDKYCLCKRLSLPKVDRGDIRAILHHQISRLTPYAVDQVYFDYRIITGKNARTDKNGNAQDHHLVDLYILPRDKCAGLIDILKEQNITVDSLLYEAEQNINFLSPFGPQSESRGRKSDHPVKIGLIAAMVAAVYLIPLGYNHYRIGGLTAEIEAIAPRAKAAALVKNRYEKLRSEAEFLVGRKKARPLTIQVINEASIILQDDTWLDQLTLKSDNLQLLGYSASASKILNVLEQSSLFQDARFMAAVVHQKKFDAERFHIAVKLDPDFRAAQSPAEEEIAQ